jgi:ATP-dependent Lhr-like helicase
MSDSSSFYLLDERIQRYIWSEGWEGLRDAQEQAIPLIVDGGRDVIVAAATAAGKTEAAFLPALTLLLKEGGADAVIVYISPLKALINDQFGRLEQLCENLEVPVWPWHGDISSSIKQRFLKRPKGVLLITPESVEATLCNRGTSVASTFQRTAFFVVDELHAFIGSERGKQLQSLMHRVEQAVGRRIPRIGLSATLGDMRLAADFLRPGSGGQVAMVESKSSGAELLISVRGYEEPEVVRVPRKAAEPDVDSVDDSDVDEPAGVTPGHIAAHLFKSLRGSNNLVFPNSKRNVEQYTHALARLCEQAQVPNEFWPHHGSLSKELRAETEAALKQKELPATAICTNTLELGIDIGAVRSVAQIGAPSSVASLRQRLGRSGRRKGEPAILRGYCQEQALSAKNTDVGSELRLATVQMAAMILLLTEGWFEPPRTNGAHLSTLVQQLLALIAQNGGVTAGQAYGTLISRGAPFAGLTADEFKALLRELGKKELIIQESTGLLLHGRVGERLVNHYSFYAAFAAPEEFRLVAAAKTLGTLPVTQLLSTGQHILFAGRTWRVEEVDEQQKTIFVSRARGGVPPMFKGGAGRVHTRVHQKMRQLLSTEQSVAFLDATARRFLQEGRAAYARLELAQCLLLDRGGTHMLFTWLGDGANEAIACLLNRRGFTSWPAGPGVEVMGKDGAATAIAEVLGDAAMDDTPPLELLLAGAKNLEREKWDWALPQELLFKTYATLQLDLDEGLAWVREHFGKDNG